MDKTLGELISDFLREKGWSQAQLARASHLTPQAISNYINNKVSFPDENAMAALAKGMGLPIEIVYKAAGIPTTPIKERDAILMELDAIFDNATPEQRDEILRYARYISSQYRQVPKPRPLPET